MEPQVEYLPISSQTISVGELMELDAGAANWTTGDASTQHWQRKAVAIESATSSATEVKAMLVHPWQLWEVDCANNSAAADNGDRMLIASGGLTVTNSGSDDTSQEACFVQLEPVGAAANAVIIGYFAGTCCGVDSDAA